MASQDRIKQVKTTKEKYGEDHYKRIGKIGSDNSTARFTSETAKAASKKRWDNYREKHDKSAT